MKIRSLLNPSKPCFSFEFFPPKSPSGEAQLWATLEDLRPLEPGFVSVTSGAGGSTRDRTLALVEQLRARTGLTAMAHVPCGGQTRDELCALLDRLAAAHVENVLALRGDPPQGQLGFPERASGFRFASELVELIRERELGLCVGAAAYPEGHLESPSREADLQHLKAKVDAGCDFVITQLFFDNAFYFDFVERARRAGVNVPVVPGIMPITSFEQLQRFVRTCGATIPMRLQLELERVKEDPDAILQLGVAHATVQCLELLQRGVPGIHFYTLNRSPASRMILSALRVRT